MGLATRPLTTAHSSQIRSFASPPPSLPGAKTYGSRGSGGSGADSLLESPFPLRHRSRSSCGSRGSGGGWSSRDSGGSDGSDGRGGSRDSSGSGADTALQ